MTSSFDKTAKSIAAVGAGHGPGRGSRGKEGFLAPPLQVSSLSAWVMGFPHHAYLNTGHQAEYSYEFLCCCFSKSRATLPFGLPACQYSCGVGPAGHSMRSLSSCRQTQERLALLYYFSADYEDALAEVDMILAADPDATQELRLFRQKLLLWKALESTLD